MAGCDAQTPAPDEPQRQALEHDALLDDAELVSAMAEPEVVRRLEEVSDAFAAADHDPQARSRLGGFQAAYVDCEEFAGVGPVNSYDLVDSLVPDDYFVIPPFPGAAIVVAQAGDCQSIEVNGWDLGPGKFAQFGVAVAPPGEPGNGDFYQLAYATTNPLLALRLRLLGANARWAPFMTYEISNDDQLTIIMPRPVQYAYKIEGPITRPDPTAEPNPTTVFNYYTQGKPVFGQILQRNVVEGIIFGEGSQVSLTPLGSQISDITGGALTFPFFSAPEIFDRADLIVTSNAL